MYVLNFPTTWRRDIVLNSLKSLSPVD